jgi:hypothetical protein
MTKKKVFMTLILDGTLIVEQNREFSYQSERLIAID